MQCLDEFIGSECETVTGDFLDGMFALLGITTLGESLHRPQPLRSDALKIAHRLAEGTATFLANRNEKQEGYKPDRNRADEREFVCKISIVSRAEEAEHGRTEKWRDRAGNRLDRHCRA